MQKDTYQRLMNYFEHHPRLVSVLRISNALITKAIYLAYPCLLIYLALWNPTTKLFDPAGTWTQLVSNPLHAPLIAAFVIPALGFVLLSIFRKRYNAPRPYEVFETPSALKKTTKGKSFPSRHVFSIFVIGTTFIYVCPLESIGIVILCLGVILAIIRVIGGIHFTKDVLVGALCGILVGILGFSLFGY